MNRALRALAVTTLLVSGLCGQNQKEKPNTPNASASDDVQELRADVDRLKVLLNQMRTNLAFVQSSQSPLKHQFELEADAWQLMIEQMDRRVKAMEERKARD
jgi:outer membrane murein-binding lipoprotein Lpp